jgi:hypothetical protein
VQQDNLVLQVVERMRNGGTGVVPDFPVDMSAEGIGQVYAQAKELLKQEEASMQDEQASKRAEFRRRLLASRPVCEACGLQISSWRDEALEEHQEKCSAYQSKVKARVEFENRRRNYERRWSKLIDRDIQNAASGLHEVADVIRELEFAVNDARLADENNKDEAVLIALRNTIESFKNLPDYERNRKYKLIESIRDSANRIHNFFDKLESDEDLAAVVKEVTGE